MIPGQKVEGGITYDGINSTRWVPPVTKEVAFVIDKSGSMASRISQVISGFNEYIQDLRQERNPSIRFSMTLFDTGNETRYVSVPLEAVEELSRYNYRPGGCTALLDAVGRMINRLEAGARPVLTPPHFLVIVMTDGQENASKEYTRSSIRSLIENRQNRGNWTFVFLGADQDAWAEASTLGFYQGNVCNYSSAETYGTMRRLAKNTLVRTKGATASTKNFFTDTDENPTGTVTSTGVSSIPGK